MRSLMVSLAFCGVVGVTSLAQDGQRPPRGEGRMMDEGRRDEWIGRMFSRAAEELDLDETQRAMFDEYSAPHRKEMSERIAKAAAEARAQAENNPAVAEGQGDAAGGRGGRGDMFGGPGARMFQMRGDPNMRGPQEAIAEVLDAMEPTLRPEQVEKLDQMRDRIDRENEGRERYRRVMTELPDALSLTPEQREQYAEMMAASRQQMGERFSAMRPLMEQMREAREAGDTAKVDELRKQMEAGRPSFEDQFGGLFEQLGPILTDEQRAALDDFKGTIGFGVPQDDAAGGSDDVKAILRLARRQKLSDEQKDEFKRVETSAMRGLREAGRDKAARQSLADHVRGEILKFLDARQAERFQQQLERLDRRALRK
jgi:LTXXQ motif family protein